MMNIQTNKLANSTTHIVSNTPSEFFCNVFAKPSTVSTDSTTFFPTPGLCAQLCADFIHLLGAQPSLWMPYGMGWDGTTDDSRKTPFKAWGFAPENENAFRTKPLADISWKTDWFMTGSSYFFKIIIPQYPPCNWVVCHPLYQTTNQGPLEQRKPGDCGLGKPINFGGSKSWFSRETFGDIFPGHTNCNPCRCSLSSLASTFTCGNL